MVDEPSPFPHRWQPFRGNGDTHLNPGGDDLGDGEPDFGWNVEEGRFEVAWSRVGAGGDEVVWSFRDGAAWSEALPLSGSAPGDLLPRLAFTSAGDTALTYLDGTAEVRYLERGVAGATWEETATLTAEGETAGRPDLADPGDGIRVVYPIAEPGGGWSIVLETRIGPPGTMPLFAREILALSSFPDDPEVRAEAQDGLLWIAWRQDTSLLGWSRLEQRGWTPPQMVSVEAGDWGKARFLAKKAALGSP